MHHGAQIAMRPVGRGQPFAALGKFIFAGKEGRPIYREPSLAMAAAFNQYLSLT